MDKYNPLQLAADTNWQIAKGYLLAVLAVHGARTYPWPTDDNGRSKYDRLKDEVEAFIQSVETQELNL